MTKVMALPPILSSLRLPVIGSPLFIVSGPELVIAQCKAGIVGTFPALNARPAAQLDEWLHQITEELAAWDRANPDRPWAAPEQGSRRGRRGGRAEGERCEGAWASSSGMSQAASPAGPPRRAMMPRPGS